MAFLTLPGELFDKQTEEYERYLPGYFSKLQNADKKYPDALENQEYCDYSKYHEWAVRKLEYSFIIRGVEQNIKKGDRLLEAGCGVSPLPFLWDKFGAKVDAIDLSPESISLMERMQNDQFFGSKSKICFQKGNVIKLPYENETFDVVVSTSVLEHLSFPDYYTALSEFWRVLKKNGILLFTCDIKAEADRKWTGEGAFSRYEIERMNQVLKAGLNSEDYIVSESQIKQFWEAHYKDNIGYEGYRRYTALGMIVRKDNVSSKEILDAFLPSEERFETYGMISKRLNDMLVQLQEKQNVIIELEKAVEPVPELYKILEERQNVIEEMKKAVDQMPLLYKELEEKEKVIKGMSEQVHLH